MSTLAALWNEEENWCDSLRTLLAAGATGVPTVNIQTAQSVTHSRSPRIEIDVEEVGRASDHMNRTAAGAWYFDHRFAVIRVDLVTNRVAATAQDHGAIRGRVRYLVDPQSLVSPVVTWYTMADLQELGSNVSVREPDGDREDVTTLRFRFEYGILPAVVPTV